MTTFDDREHAFESKFAHDEEMQFKALVRRNKLVGLWAAGLMGKNGDEAQAYAKSLAVAEVNDVKHDELVRRITADLEGHVTSDAIRAKMVELLPEAKAQIMAEAD
ncbi:DUF1476 domain-containing protein [Pukyongiella litopenaei]|uniref:DUF1476 domain-containing protein n=1 Tax=Pukyongiella litopenaei TaxID=2605946 RepID=A0A2S0ML12_9RHOB|nr:DUF1476 domain-containing protein [Pukyongiella litopenaei]AVO36569.1 DUF1476 domain-containing protein [Pukyongiella litopenaei]